MSQPVEGLPSWVPSLDRPSSITKLRIAIGVVVVLSLLAFVVRGADTPPDPYVSGRPVPLGPEVAPGVRVPLDGFDETRITVKTVAGGLLSWCLLLAATADLRARGLMTVTDPTLGGYDGMLFRYDEPTTGGFYMRNTPMPLSIAFIGADGGLVTVHDMAPCEDVDGCPNYSPTGPYVFTIEVPQQLGLARLGIEPGALVIDDQLPCS